MLFVLNTTASSSKQAVKVFFPESPRFAPICLRNSQDQRFGFADPAIRAEFITAVNRLLEPSLADYDTIARWLRLHESDRGFAALRGHDLAGCFGQPSVVDCELFRHNVKAQGMATRPGCFLASEISKDQNGFEKARLVAIPCRYLFGKMILDCNIQSPRAGKQGGGGSERPARQRFHL